MPECTITNAPTEAPDDTTLTAAAHAVMRFHGYTDAQIATAASRSHTAQCTWDGKSWACTTAGTPNHPDTDKLTAVTATLRIGLSHTLSAAATHKATLAAIDTHITTLEAHPLEAQSWDSDCDDRRGGLRYDGAATNLVDRALADIRTLLTTPSPAPTPAPSDTLLGRTARIRARHQAATPGPWTARICAGDDDNPHHPAHGNGIWSMADVDDVLVDEVYLSAANAHFIAEAHQDIPVLLDALETAEAHLAQVRLTAADLEVRGKALSAKGDYTGSSLNLVRALGRAEGYCEAAQDLRTALGLPTEPEPTR